jgi:Bifunctional DNA primase/polymerase, N-terminal
MTILSLRLNLKAGGYAPIPVDGKRPPMTGWSKLGGASDDDIRAWDKAFPDAASTGILTGLVPALDIDVTNEEAAEAVEALVREHFEEAGYFLVRIGRAPKRAILFRTDRPFKKMTAELISPSGGSGQKLEFLCDGQQLVAFGLHKETKQPYRWHGGEPGQIRREDLPYIHEEEAQRLVRDAVDLLCRDFAYKRAAARRRKGNGAADQGGAEWGHLAENIRKGHALHDSLRDLAGKLVASGMDAGAAVNFLRGLMDQAEGEHDARWKARRDDIPRLVDSAVQKPKDQAPRTPQAIDQVLDAFDKWLLLRDTVPIYAVLGTIAANLLEGDPVWLGLIGPPSSAKTEILNSTSLLPHVVQAATMTPASLLSGTPKKSFDKDAKGGLLRQIGDFGIIVLKDFGSVLSMRADNKAETLACLREIFDGHWTRHMGTDGGKTLAWKGKVGLLFGATGVIDAHYSVIGSMGDRFLLSRLTPITEGQLERALKHLGAATKQMRTELAEAVAGLFAGKRPEPKGINTDEIRRLDRTVSLAVCLRGAVDRDRGSREVEAVLGAEGPARIGLALERLLAGLDTLGVDRETAFGVVEQVAMDSVPPLRRSAYEHLCKAKVLTGEHQAEETPDIAEALGLPTNTVRRALEDLAAYRLARRERQGAGKADKWIATPPTENA